MTDDQVIALVREELEKIGLYGTRFTADQLAGAVVKARGWKLVMTAMSGTAALGAAVLCDNRLLVFYREDMRPFHRDYVICHELAHVILGHLKEGREPLQYTEEEEKAAEQVAQHLMRLSTDDGRYNSGLQCSYRKLFE